MVMTGDLERSGVDSPHRMPVMTLPYSRHPWRQAFSVARLAPFSLPLVEQPRPPMTPHEYSLHTKALHSNVRIATCQWWQFTTKECPDVMTLPSTMTCEDTFSSPFIVKLLPTDTDTSSTCLTTLC